MPRIDGLEVHAEFQSVVKCLHKGVGDIMIIVVRYFGGIKLGAGGLTRAYGQAAQAVMEVLPTQTQIPTSEFTIHCNFSLEQQVRYFCSQAEAIIEQVDYSKDVAIKLSIPNSNIDKFKAQLAAFDCKLQIER
jgi:putative IMPACT (imprinted ancient) family translation regulator